MKYQTPGGVEYEVEELLPDLFATPDPRVRELLNQVRYLSLVIARLEEVIQEKDEYIAQCWLQRNELSKERRAWEHRVEAAEALLDNWWSQKESVVPES